LQGSVFELTLNDHDPSSRVSQLLSINCGTAADGGQVSGGLEFVPKSLAYTPDGQLILSDEKNHIYAVGRNDGRLDELAGSLSFCKRRVETKIGIFKKISIYNFFSFFAEEPLFASKSPIFNANSSFLFPS
jgi:hypothetical protein